jgi:soluble P-type ATPase
MLTFDIPGYKVLRLAHLVMDYNGTLAVDGKLVDGVAGRLETLAKDLHIHVITADTFGLVQSQLAALPCQVSVLGQENQAEAKLRYVQELGLEQTVCIGNGRNDPLDLLLNPLRLTATLRS